jgi:hypothetical protein
MKNLIKMANILCLLAGLQVFGAAYAGNLKHADNEDFTANNTDAYYWYDGDQKRTLWLNPKLLVEFTIPGETQSYPQPQRSYTGVGTTLRNVREVSSKQAGARILQIEGDDSAKISQSAARGFSMNRSISPVFHTAPNSGSMKRALPGNVIVYFDPSWTPIKIDKWVDDKGLEIAKKLPFSHRKVYIIKTAPGLEALRVANELYESGEVEMALPNWWTEISTQ